jgi:serine/threonine-protein kinase
MLQAQAEGRVTDFLATLVGQKILSPSQAAELRQALDKTSIDASEAQAQVSAESTSDSTRSMNTAANNGDTPLPGSGQELRSLGEYRILRRLGEGGMGAVYLGYHEGRKRHVAIKVLPDPLAAIQSHVDRFYREGKSLTLLDHPNIVQGIAVARDEATGKHYLVLEYVDGPSAHALLDRFGRLSVGDAVHVILDIARALEHAHSRNIIHRDIKPDNILLTQSGLAKLSDLGLAKRIDDVSHLTGARQGFGTPYYMPYEQALSAKQADGRSDIFALGATLYHLVTGEVPFPGSNPLEIAEKKDLGNFAPASELNPEVPEVLDQILNKMMARAPEDRYQTASELIVDLERSKLAAPVPSFIDPDRALQDPLVRARLTAPAQPTRMDLDAAKGNPPERSSNPNLWYLRYRNREGRWCQTRATTQQITQRLREGRMPATIEASHEPQGEFKPLSAYPEFHAVAVSRLKPRKPSGNGSPREKPAVPKVATEVPAPGPTRRRGYWLVPIGLGLLVIAILVYLFRR